jgi:hypothetical protein
MLEEKGEQVGLGEDFEEADEDFDCDNSNANANNKSLMRHTLNSDAKDKDGLVLVQVKESSEDIDIDEEVQAELVKRRAEIAQQVAVSSLGARGGREGEERRDAMLVCGVQFPALIFSCFFFVFFLLH